MNWPGVVGRDGARRPELKRGAKRQHRVGRGYDCAAKENVAGFDRVTGLNRLVIRLESGLGHGCLFAVFSQVASHLVFARLRNRVVFQPSQELLDIRPLKPAMPTGQTNVTNAALVGVSSQGVRVNANEASCLK